MRRKFASHHVADCSSPFCQLESSEGTKEKFKIFLCRGKPGCSWPEAILQCLDIFDCHDWGDAIGFCWVETRDDAKHFVMLRTALTTKNYLVQIVNSAEVKKSWESPIIFSFFQKEASKFLLKVCLTYLIVLHLDEAQLFKS